MKEIQDKRFEKGRIILIISNKNKTNDYYYLN